MACRGVYFALSADEEQQLLACSSDDCVIEAVQSIEEKWDAGRLVEVDKSWEAIHRCLGDGSLSSKQSSSLARVVLGGKSLYAGADYIVRHLGAAEVCQLAAEIKPVSQEWFRERYFALGKKRFGLYFASNYGEFVSHEDFEYSWNYFEAVREFFQNACREGRAVVFTVDQ